MALCLSLPTHLLFCLLVIGTCMALTGFVVTMHGFASWCGVCNDIDEENVNGSNNNRSNIRAYQIIGPLSFVLGVCVVVSVIYLKSMKKSKQTSAEHLEITSEDCTDGENFIVNKRIISAETNNHNHNSHLISCDDTSYPHINTYLLTAASHDNDPSEYQTSPRVVMFPPPGQTYLQPWQPTNITNGNNPSINNIDKKLLMDDEFLKKDEKTINGRSSKESFLLSTLTEEEGEGEDDIEQSDLNKTVDTSCL